MNIKQALRHMINRVSQAPNKSASRYWQAKLDRLKERALKEGTEANYIGGSNNE